MKNLAGVVRNVVALVLLGGPALLAACSSQSPDDASAQSDALGIPKCPIGAYADCQAVDNGGGGTHPMTTPLQCQCIPFDFYTVAHMPTTGDDVCGTVEVAPPAALASHGCTWGVLVDNQPIWACPVGTPLPPSLGVVHSPSPQPLPTCVWRDGFLGANLPYSGVGATCEAVESFTQSTSNCIGNAPPGWTFILDTEWQFVYRTKADGGQGGGCTGQCAEAIPPTTKIGGQYGHN